MFSILWTWVSGICRQKRILILLCTFASSFILFNYAILSSSTNTTPRQRENSLFYNSNGDSQEQVSNKKRATYADDDGNIRKNYKELANRKKLLLLQSQSLSKKRLVPDQNLLVQQMEAENLQSVKISSEKLNSTTVHYPSVVFIREIDHDHNNRIKSRSSNLPKSSKKLTQVYNNNENDDDYDQQQQQQSSNDILLTSYLSSQSKTETNQPHPQPVVLQNASSNIITEVVPHKESINLSIKDKDNPTMTSLTSEEEALPLPYNSIEHSSINNNDNQQQQQQLSFPETFPLASPQPSSPSTFSTTVSPSLINLAKISKATLNERTFSTSSSSSSSPFYIPPCPNPPSQLRRVQKRKKNLTVIENFIMGWNRVKCDESITYTTHGDFRYLDNLVPLVERWNGPLSLALYTPGTDLEKTLRMISYLKMCTTSKIDEWVTFHLIYDVKFSQKPTKTSSANNKTGDILWLDSLYQAGKWRDCSKHPSFNKFDSTFRINNKLLYPINIARNIARSAASTYFVLASDIELYPSINLIPSFLKMLKQGKETEKGKKEKENEPGANGSSASIKNAFTTVAESLVAKLFFPSVTSTVMKYAGSDNGNNSNNEIIMGEDHPLLEKQSRSIIQTSRHKRDTFLYRGSNSNRNFLNKYVFVLPVFEVKKDVLPCQVETKKQLLSLLQKKTAVIFHHSICPQCHTFPRYAQWRKHGQQAGADDPTEDNCPNNKTVRNGNNSTAEVLPMKIFHATKRKYPFHLWEPIFIGTKEEPIYDERLSWEGLRDKMVSGYVMCALNYDFFILDNAFLVHKPGIRKVVHLVTKTVMNQDRLINYRIRSELLRKFGKHDKCAL